MITIKEVKTRSDLRKFVEFPNKLYKGNAFYVPPLAVDEMDNFNPKKNPAYEFCETKLFLAYKDNKLVGRIAGLISYAYIKKIGKNVGRFTRFDAIDDLEVTKALFNAVKEWHKEHDIYTMIGPLGFTDIDREGMLIDGFEEMNMSITIYNYPYYKEHLSAIGFEKDVDWVEYQVIVSEKMDERLERVSDLVQKRYGYHCLKFKKNKEVIPYAFKMFKVINAAFEKLYGTVPLTDNIISKCVKDYIPLINLDYTYVVVDKNEEVVGFGLLMPSIAKALKKHKGHLFPFGWASVLKALKGKNDILEMYFIAVEPKYQNMGVNALIMHEALKACMKNKVKFAETGPELETNVSVQDQWKMFKTRQHRRRRSWIYNFENEKIFK